MLDGYFGNMPSAKERQRLLAVQAALEIAKASVSGATAIGGVKSGYDLDNVSSKINELANAIQAALNK